MIVLLIVSIPFTIRLEGVIYEDFMELNTDSFEIKNYEITEEGYVITWIVGGIPNKELIYDGGARKEIINEDALFNEKSIKTAMGKPITYPAHPPKPVNSRNYNEFMKGVVLQEYSKDDSTGALVLSAIVHDSELAEGIISGKIKYISAGYTATKEPNADGVLVQTDRVYNHFTGLGEEYTPRAGEESKILIFDENITQQKDGETTTQPQNNQSAKTVNTGSNDTSDNGDGRAKSKAKTQKEMNQDTEEKVELLVLWKPILEENNKAIDYSLDSNGIKRQVLSCYYPEKTIKALNDDAVLNGFWLNFVSNQMQTDDEESLPVSGYQRKSSPASNQDSTSNRDAFTKMLEGAK